MQPHWKSLIILILLGLSSARGQAVRTLHEKRQTTSDLELSGELAGLPPNSTRYLTRDDLLAMPQVNFTVTDDTNFSGAVKIRGVKLEDLARRLGASPSADMVVAICDDGYRAHYTRAYLIAHHPVLVLQVNDEPPSGWPKAVEDHTSDMGPYMISHPKFTPGARILSHVEQAEIPWGVVRLEFREEKIVLGAIAPRGSNAGDPDVQLASASPLRIASGVTMQGTKEGLNQAARGKCSELWQRRRLDPLPLMFTILARKTRTPKCPEIPNTTTQPSAR